MADKILSIADGLHDELPSTTTAKAGRILITTDRGEMYYEPEDKKRVKINKADQTYTPESENAQSGKAVAEAMSNKMDKSNPSGTGSFSLNRKADTTVGDYSFAEGSSTTASGYASHAEGYNTTASSYASHAEGNNTTASGYVSHAEGYSTIVSGDRSHAEGNYTTASGKSSHAEGAGTKASGNYSHAEGYNTTASSSYQHVQGKFNIEDKTTYADIIGNGSSDTKRSNAYTLDWNGNAWYAGDVYVGSTSGTNRDEGSRKLATEEYTNTVSANVIKDNVSGLNVVQITDKNNILSPVTHEMGVRVKSKNLLNYELFEPSYTKNGVTFTNNGDGTVTANGTATADTFYYFDCSNKLLGKYTLSGCPSGGSTTTYLMGLGASNFPDVGSGVTRNFPDQQVPNIFIKIFSGVTVENLVFKPQLEEGSTVTSYTLYVPDLTAVKVSRCGKNLFDYSVLENADYITVNDRLTGEFVFKKVSALPETPIPAKEKTSYYVSGYMKGVTEGQNVSCAAYYTDGSNTNLTATTVLDSYVRFSGVTRADKTLSYIKFGASGGIKVGTSFKNVQVELNTEATDYEPYVETEYTPTADGTVNGVTSLYPNTSLMTDTDGVLIDCEYNADTKKYVDTKVDDVQINGASIVENGVANIPFVKVSGDAGVVKIYGAGLQIIEAATGRIGTVKAVNAVINSRQDNYSIICPSNLDYAVKSAMCDGKGTAWSETEQQAAMDRIGITDIIGDINTTLDSIIEMQNSFIGGN